MNETAQITDAELIEENAPEQATALTQSASTNVVQMDTTGLSPAVQAIMSGQVNADQVSQMLAVQKEWEANEARKAFYVDLAAFRKEAPVLAQDRRVQFGSKNGGAGTDYRHTSLGYAMATVNPILGRHNMSVSWKTKQENGVTVTCELAHALGHIETTTLSGQPDATGNKNILQQTKSAITYLQRTTLFSLLGLASSYDDDGEAAAPAPAQTINQDQQNMIHSLITENNLPLDKWLDKFEKVNGSRNLSDIPRHGYQKILSTLNAAIKAKKEGAQ